MADRERRIFGPPGTGKTTYLVESAEDAVDRYGPDMVSICSLTKSAIRVAVGRDLPVDEEGVTTLHARCKRSLSAPAPAESHVGEFIGSHGAWFSNLDSMPQSLTHRRHVDDPEDLAEAIVAGRGLTRYERVQVLRQRMVPTDSWSSDLRTWYGAWNDWCTESGRPDFTGWLEECLSSNALPPQEVVYVDEAQDHTPLQLAVLRSWDTKYLILIGDDDQNLYEWSGSDPQAFLDSPIENVRERVLEQSYRVPQSIHQISMEWALRIRGRREKIYKPREEMGSLSRTSYGIDSKGLPSELLQDPSRTYMMIASCGFMLDNIISQLIESGIPFHNPYRPASTRWNPLNHINEILVRFRQKRMWVGQEALSWIRVLGSDSGAFRPHQKTSLMRKCRNQPDDPLTYETLTSAFPDGIRDRILDRDTSLFREFRGKGASSMWDYALHVGSLSLEDREPRVIVGTIHSVKGGEADEVYLFPDLSGAGSGEYMKQSGSVFRLFYVGMTRARSTLHLCSASRDSRGAVSWPEVG